MIKRNGGNGNAVNGDELINDLTELLFLNDKADFGLEFVFGNGAIHKAQILRNRVVEDYAADCCDNNGALCAAVFLFGEADFNR